MRSHHQVQGIHYHISNTTLRRTSPSVQIGHVSAVMISNTTGDSFDAPDFTQRFVATAYHEPAIWTPHRANAHLERCHRKSPLETMDMAELGIRSRAGNEAVETLVHLRPFAALLPLAVAEEDGIPLGTISALGDSGLALVVGGRLVLSRQRLLDVV